MGRHAEVKAGDLVEVFLDRADPLEPLTATEVGDALDVTRKTAFIHLEELADEGGLRTKKTGARGRIWWPVLDLWFPSMSPTDLQNVAVDDVLARVQGETVTTDRAIPPVAERAIRSLHLPGTGETEAARREAIRDLYRYLSHHGEASKADLCAQIDANALGYSSAESFWSNLIIRLGVMGDLPGIVPPGEGGHRYRFVGV